VKADETEFNNMKICQSVQKSLRDTLT